jgi:hypothetical protein
MDVMALGVTKKKIEESCTNATPMRNVVYIHIINIYIYICIHTHTHTHTHTHI